MVRQSAEHVERTNSQSLGEEFALCFQTISRMLMCLGWHCAINKTITNKSWHDDKDKGVSLCSVALLQFMINETWGHSFWHLWPHHDGFAKIEFVVKFFALDRTSRTKSCEWQDKQVRMLVPCLFLRSSPLSLTLPSFIEKKNFKWLWPRVLRFY